MIKYIIGISCLIIGAILSPIILSLIFSITVPDGIILSVVSGIVASLVATLVYLIAAFYIKVDCSISEKIAYNPMKNEFVIKVINNSKHMHMTDITTELTERTEFGVSGGMNVICKKIELLNSHVRIIHSQKDGSDHAQFAQWFIVNGDVYPLKDLLSRPEAHLVFTLTAKHAITNIVTMKSIKYHDSDDIVDGLFRYGDTMEIVKKNTQTREPQSSGGNNG